MAVQEDNECLFTDTFLYGSQCGKGRVANFGIRIESMLKKIIDFIVIFVKYS